MKIHMIALAAAAALVGSAQAAQPTATEAAAAPFQITIHGSSALQNLVEGMVAQNCAVAADLSIWRSKAQAWFGGSADTKDGASANIYSCVMKVGNDFGATYDNQLVTITKREAGGSSAGVFPVGKPSAVAALGTNGLNALKTMNIATCDATANTVTPATGPVYGQCTGEIALTNGPDMGISDEEPAVFNTTINRTSAFGTLTVSDSDFQSPPVAFVQTVMGLAVNDKLYADLQADQGTSGVPSVSSIGFANLWTQSYDTSNAWNVLCKDPLNCSALGLANTHINLAVRAIGSGTRAAAGLYFNNTPSGKSAKQWATGSTTNSFSSAVDSLRSTFNASSSGNVIGALDACGDGTAASPKYCVGILGLEQNLTGKKVKFVNVDNSAPALARFGEYGIVYESTYQVNKLASPAAQALAVAFGGAAAKPVNINQAFGGSGVLALPAACGAFPYSGTEAIVCSRVTRNGSSNNTLAIAK